MRISTTVLKIVANPSEMQKYMYEGGLTLSLHRSKT